MATQPNQATLATYAVGAGVTQLIPVPFIDDKIRDKVHERMVRALAAPRGVPLTEQDVHTYAGAPESGSIVKRVATSLVAYPLKKIFKKTFIVLGVKGAIDTVSSSYHLGYLIDFAFASKWHEVRTAEQLRLAIDVTCNDVGTSPVEHAARAALDGSRAAIGRSWARFRKKKDAIEASDAIDAGTESATVDVFVKALGAVPVAHFERLRARMARELGLPLESADLAVFT